MKDNLYLHPNYYLLIQVLPNDSSQSVPPVTPTVRRSAQGEGDSHMPQFAGAVAR